MPDGCVDILFSSLAGEPQTLSVVGLMTKANSVEIGAERLLFGVRFRPGMAAAFLPDAAQLNDQTVALEDLIPAPSAKELFARLADSATLEDMLRVMDNSLRPLEPLDRGQKVLQELTATRSPLDSVFKERWVKHTSDETDMP